jgi:hypothetical protein
MEEVAPTFEQSLSDKLEDWIEAIAPDVPGAVDLDGEKVLNRVAFLSVREYAAWLDDEELFLLEMDAQEMDEVIYDREPLPRRFE